MAATTAHPSQAAISMAQCLLRNLEGHADDCGSTMLDNGPTFVAASSSDHIEPAEQGPSVARYSRPAARCTITLTRRRSPVRVVHCSISSSWCDEAAWTSKLFPSFALVKIGVERVCRPT